MSNTNKTSISHNALFLNMPFMGIFIDKDLHIQETNKIFATHSSNLKKIKDFSELVENFSPTKTNQQSEIDSLRESFGQDEGWYYSLEDFFTKKLKIDSKIYELKYSPIFENEILVSLGIFLVEQSTGDASHLVFNNEKEKQDITRFLECIRFPKTNIATTCNEFYTLQQKLKNAKHFPLATAYRSLHTMQGVARAVNFSNLKNIVIHYEDELIKRKNTQLYDENFLEEASLVIKKEWNLIFEHLGCLFMHSDHVTENKDQFNYLKLHVGEVLIQYLDEAVEGITSKLQSARDHILNLKNGKKQSLDSLENSLKDRANEVSKSLNKQVDLEINFSGVLVPQKDIGTIAGIFLHMVNNAIDHGIEAPDVRLKAGKKPRGRIILHAQNAIKGSILLKIEDDGGGICLKDLKEKAIKKGFLEKNKEISDENLLKIIFTQGFSTKDEKTDLSGRGIGLDAVADAVLGLSGNITNLKTKISKGTVFEIELYA